MDKLLIAIAVIWGGFWLLGQILGWLARVSTEFGRFLERTGPGRDGVIHAIGDPLGRLREALADYRLIDRFLIVFVVACILMAAVDGPWMVRTLDGFGGRNFPFAGWALFGTAIGVAMSATSRVLELGWIGSAKSVARVPDIAHLRSGEKESARSFRVRRIAGLLALVFLLSALGAGYWRNADYRPDADPDGKAAVLSAAVSAGNMTVLNGALSDAATRLDSDPGKALGMLLALSQATKDAVRPEVSKIVVDTGRYIKNYREETEKSVTDGTPDALARSEAFAQIDNTASLNWLGRLFETGKGGAKSDLVKAFSSYEAAAALGDKKAAVGQENLARVMAAQKDEAVRQAAFAYLEKRAQGDTPAGWYWLGEWYRNSTQAGDSRKSETWLVKAVDQETDSAVKDQAFNGLLKIVEPSPVATKVLDEQAPKYVKGKNPDLKKVAYDYLERRANAGDPGAIMWMAYRFREGDSVAKDEKKAHDWFLKAALQDKDQGIKDRAFAELGETEPPRREEKSLVSKPEDIAEKPTAKVPAPVIPVASPPVSPEPRPFQAAVKPEPSPPNKADSANKVVLIPPNSHPNQYSPTGWSCNTPQHKQIGNECQFVYKPENSHHNQYVPQGWSCDTPQFRQVGNECQYVGKPANSHHNQYVQQGWSCDAPQFRQVGNECQYIAKPENSHHNQYVPQGWSCDSPQYRQAGSECQYITKPSNSHHNQYVSQGWSCDTPLYKQVGDECWKLQTSNQ